jgi:hypothetical protein
MDTYLVGGILLILAYTTALSILQARILLKFVDFRLNKLNEPIAEAFNQAIDGRIEQLSSSLEPPNPWAQLAANYIESQMKFGGEYEVTQLQPKGPDGKFIKDTSLNTE